MREQIYTCACAHTHKGLLHFPFCHPGGLIVVKAVHWLLSIHEEELML